VAQAVEVIYRLDWDSVVCRLNVVLRFIIYYGVYCMPQRSTATSKDSPRRRRNGSWLDRKLRSIRESQRLKKQFQQLLVIIAAMLIAFILGFYFIGPSFSSGG
jgi:Na+/H+ antiporter NhaD/arsenite permease-like protein